MGASVWELPLPKHGRMLGRHPARGGCSSARLDGRSLLYRDLIANNGLPAGTRPAPDQAG